jgi:hypothetical protein
MLFSTRDVTVIDARGREETALGVAGLPKRLQAEEAGIEV